MAEYFDNGITFNNVKTAGIDLGGPFVREGFTGVHPRSGGIVNVADVDWNGANLGNEINVSDLSIGEQIIINTTGQLLSYISTLSEKIVKIENILTNL